MFSAGMVILNYIKTYSAQEAMSQDNNPDGFLIDAFKHFAMSKEPINVVILVGDKSEANTDTMMVANYDPPTNRLNIMSIPRDTKVVLGNGKSVKINSIYANKGGNTLLMSILSDILDIDIKYYAYINLATFRNIIDLLDGIWIDIPVDLDYDDPIQDLHIHLKKGKKLLDGKKAEDYLRYRHPNDGAYTKELLQYYDGSDLKRIEAQQNFIEEFIKQKAKISNLPKLNNIIDTVFENLKTNIPLSEVVKLIKLDTIKDFSADKVNIHTLPGYSMDTSPWYYIYEKDKITELIKENFSVK